MKRSFEWCAVQPSRLWNICSSKSFLSVLNDNVLVDNKPANIPRQNEGPLEGYQRKLVILRDQYPEHGHLKVRTLAKARWFGWREAQACPRLGDHTYSLVHHYSQLANCSYTDGGVVRFCGHKDTRAGGLGTFSQRNTSLIGTSAQFNHSKELEPKTVLPDSNGKVYSS